VKRRYFKILLDYGHLGNGNSLEVARYVTARNCVEALVLGNRMPGVKRKREKTGAIKVMEVSYSEYLAGRKNAALQYPLYTYKSQKCS
jgi:hypothetical protein